ncbi:MAG: DUF932 domain-containing protein [Planctomycetota bacterium]
MSHEFESGIVVGQQAWHGLATVLQDNPSIEDAIREAKLDWDVVEVPLQAPLVELVPDEAGEISERRTTLEVPGHKAIVRATDRSVLGVVSEAYKPFQNRDAFNWFAPLVQDGTLRIETAGSLQKGRKVWILGRYAEDIEVIDGDKLAPFLLIAIGHDGKMSVRINNTPILVVCMNTARAALGQTDDEGMAAGSRFREVQGGIAIPHMGDVKAKAEMARAAIVDMNRQLGLSVQAFRKMHGVHVTTRVVREIARGIFDPDYTKAKELVTRFRARLEMTGDENIRQEVRDKIAELEAIINDPDKMESRSVKKTVEAFYTGPGADRRGRTAWGLFNALTYQIDHGKQGSADARLTSSWFGLGAQQRQKAFDAAMEIAK